MQPQLEEGEFCPPDYPTVICKAGPRVVWVGQRKSGFTGRCSVTMRANESALAAATRKLNELKNKAGSSDAPADDSHRPGACVEEQQPAATEEQQPSATEVLVWRPKRQRQVPDFLQPCDALREFATGSRKRGRQQSDDERCTKRACECAAVSAERDDYKQRCEEQAVAHMRLREEVSAIAHEAAGGDTTAAPSTTRPPSGAQRRPTGRRRERRRRRQQRRWRRRQRRQRWRQQPRGRLLRRAAS